MYEEQVFYVIFTPHANFLILISLFSVKSFTIIDRGVGTVSAVKIRLTQRGAWPDYWLVEQVRRVEFSFIYTLSVIIIREDT